MNYAEAKRTALKLFGPGTVLKRTSEHHTCLVLDPSGFPIGDGGSWLEALRSAGTLRIMQNEKKRVEAEKLKAFFEEYVKETGHDPEKMTEEQLFHFEGWMAKKVQEKPEVK